MKEWTSEERYTELSEERLDELRELHEASKQSRWCSAYHVQPVTGLMGDINGFSLFKDRWHLFFQWFPYGPVHGLKHWYHVSSDDLLHWENEGAGIIPGDYADNKGAFSGSGFAEGDTLYLPYTGNRRDENWVRHPYQLLAMMDTEGNIIKQKEPLAAPLEEYTEHQRDPKLFYRKEDGYYYFLIGVQNHDKKGKFALFRSKEIQTGWEFAGELKIRGYEDLGYMVECPDLERAGDKWVLLFSPQGLEPKGDEFNNLYNNVYLIGDMDFDNLEFIPEGEMKELDRGFDFYAAQCASQDKWPDKLVLGAWMGVSDYTYPPTAEEGYFGLQIMPRLLSIENGELKQRPLPVMEEIKKDKVFHTLHNETDILLKDGILPQACVIEARPEDKDLLLRLFTDKEDSGFLIKYDAETKYLVIDKSGLFHQTNTEYGTQRRVHLENGLQELEIFVDRSSIEIFVNDGEYVLTARIFPTESETGFVYETEGEITVFTAETTVRDDFVIFPWQKNQ